MMKNVTDIKIDHQDMALRFTLTLDFELPLGNIEGRSLLFACYHIGLITAPLLILPQDLSNTCGKLFSVLFFEHK